jgi:hypothetical protein
MCKSLVSKSADTDKQTFNFPREEKKISAMTFRLFYACLLNVYWSFQKRIVCIYCCLIAFYSPSVVLLFHDGFNLCVIKINRYAPEKTIPISNNIYYLNIGCISHSLGWTRYSFSPYCDHSKMFITIQHQNEHFNLMRNINRPCVNLWCQNLLTRTSKLFRCLPFFMLVQILNLWTKGVFRVSLVF